MTHLIWSLGFLASTNSFTLPLQTEMINTHLGSIAVHVRWVEGTTPLVLLHGVYLDHQLWARQMEEITDRTIIAIDMPMHGASQLGPTAWSMEDCSEMLIEVLDELYLDQVYAVGHSWGGMTILRAASEHPERFVGLGLCNTPLEGTSPVRRKKFKRQHWLLSFKSFYARKAGESMLGQSSRSTNEELLPRFEQQFLSNSNQSIKQTDWAVIMEAKDSQHLPGKLVVPAIALRGEEDYVKAPIGLETTVVPGGHISPWEQPEAVTQFIKEVIALAGNP
ncbi:MAG: alpha/beta hydrolase [Bacteroidota bacterium]